MTVPQSQQKGTSAERLIVALDVASAHEADRIVAELLGLGCAFKVGLQLFTAAGPEFVRKLAVENRIFLDLKFHDIPNTVAKAAVEAARLGVWLMNVHAMGGREMMLRCKNELDGVYQKEGHKPKVIAVTVLTSSDANALTQVGIERGVEEMVLNLARITAECGLDGVVASVRETRAIRAAVPNKDFLIVTPGIRPSRATFDDQKRVATPGGAIAAGSDFLVVGRPIVGAADRRSALQAIITEIKEAISS